MPCGSISNPLLFSTSIITFKKVKLLHFCLYFFSIIKIDISSIYGENGILLVLTLYLHIVILVESIKIYLTVINRPFI